MSFHDQDDDDNDDGHHLKHILGDPHPLRQSLSFARGRTQLRAPRDLAAKKLAHGYVSNGWRLRELDWLSVPNPS